MDNLLLSLLYYQNRKEGVLLECGLPEKFLHCIQVELCSFALEFHPEEVSLILERFDTVSSPNLPYALCFFDAANHLKLAVPFADLPSAFERACRLLAQHLSSFDLSGMEEDRWGRNGRKRREGPSSLQDND